MTCPATEILAAARASGRRRLLESEGLALLGAWGLSVPRHRVVADAADAAALDEALRLPGERVVLKILAEEVAHKSEVGGVRIVERTRHALTGEIEAMAARFAGTPYEGFLVEEFVAFDRTIGGELLIGLRWTVDFGPVVTVGLGGLYTEFLAREFRPGGATTILTADAVAGGHAWNALAGRPLGRLVGGGLRNQPARIAPDRLDETLAKLAAGAATLLPEQLSEIEINPLALTGRGPVALDVLARLGEPPAAVEPERPLAKIARLMQPESIGIVGVSRRRNPGRIILENVLREGFPPDRIHIVKPGGGEIDGCRCHDGFDDLPGSLDLLILAIDAGQVPETLERVVADRVAESIVLIPGGLGEHPDSAHRVARMRETLRASREREWRGPVINGGNCLGIRSRPGRYDTLFIPEAKLPRARQSGAPLALISQSGALACTKMSRLYNLDPHYVISVGNQFDLTLGDYLTWLADDAEVEVFAFYVEGFRPLDGRRWLAAARRIVDSGRSVILYRAGRTPDGALASASHTASIAGDYEVTRQLAAEAGVLVADGLAQFDDLVRCACALRGREPRGWRLGALSNAGFECVAIADHAGRFRLTPFEDATTERLRSILRDCRLEAIVDARNPLDVTPIMGDGPFVEAFRTVLADPSVDIGLVGCVPMTGALDTLAAGTGHDEDLTRPGAVAAGLIDLWRETDKPFVAVVDAGPPYDALARELERGGIPTFRTADRALRVLGVYCASRRPAGSRS